MSIPWIAALQLLPEISLRLSDLFKAEAALLLGVENQASGF
jgi:hypothetical protein